MEMVFAPPFVPQVHAELVIVKCGAEHDNTPLGPLCE
jgi:hypothetical protein